MGAMASQITSLTIVYLTVYSGANQRKHQISVTGEFPHKWPVTRNLDAVFDRKAGDLRRHRAHYDVTVMKLRVTGFVKGIQWREKTFPFDDVIVKKMWAIPHILHEWYIFRFPNENNFSEHILLLVFENI